MTVSSERRALTGISETLDKLGYGRSLLSNSHIYAVELLLLIGAVVESLLVDDGVDGHSGLTGLTISDDQFSLATTDGHQTATEQPCKMYD